MPRYAPLPRVELDPRTEAELVKAAARRVYEASSSTLNDFSSGSPIMALLEGQSFAQAEFLQFANQFPESVLVEWIGPFLGAQRRTGAGAQVDITFFIDGQDQAFEIFAGYQLGTNPNLTGGESIKFVTLERLTIPKGSISGTVRAIALETGTQGNVPANTITRTLTSLAGVRTVTNVEPAFGGQNAELLSEVKERFFSLIRRRNPVSAEDWTDWFSDALGAGTSVSVLARHSEKGVYLHDSDYVRSNPAVTFFVLNPDGTPITNTQRNALQTLMKWSLPIEFLGYIYPMEVNDVDVNISLEYNPAKSYAQNLETLSGTLRSSMFSVMTPNAVFPIDYDQSVLDLQNALTATFPITLGVGNRFTDPNIIDISAYHSPTNIGTETFVGTASAPFTTGPRLQENDLVVEYASGEPYFYPVLVDFDPDVNDTRQYVNNDLLDFQIIKELVAGQYERGEVISFPDTNTLHVVLTPFFFSTRDSTDSLITNGFLSAAKEFSPFVDTLYYDNGAGNYNPDIIPYEQDDVDTVQFIPLEPAGVSAQARIGYPVYVVKQMTFTVAPASASLGNAQAAGNVSDSYVQVSLLQTDTIYSQGSFVKTPNLTELTANQINADSCYILEAEGLKETYFKVNKQFSFFLEDEDIGYTDKVEQLILEGYITAVSIVTFSECGRNVYEDKPFRYSARFKMGEYLRYREEGGFDSAELQECFAASESCSEVSFACSELLEASLPLPRYFQARRDFTPHTTNLDEMVAAGLMYEVDRSIFTTTYSVNLTFYVPTYSANITQAMLNENVISSVADLTNGETVEITTAEGHNRGVWMYVDAEWVETMPSVPTYRDMFRFAPGDVVTLRQESTVQSYKAVAHFTPILSPQVYIQNGLLERDEISSGNVPWSDPTYHLEDIVYENKRGALSFYRILKPITPNDSDGVWNGLEVVNTARVQELKEKTQKIVVKAACTDQLFSRLRDGASTVKLGVANMKFRSKDSFAEGNTYVWESTEDAKESPALSYSPTITSWNYSPTDYGNGTLGL